jgi:DNA helicase HerA-like ATPase
MPINRNGSLGARHRLILGTTGAGKSQACKNLIPPKGMRFLAFDPEGEHSRDIRLGSAKGKLDHGQAWGFVSFADFCRELIEADKSRVPFRLAYTGAKNNEDFARFCRVAFDVLDGNHDTEILLEEAPQFTRGGGPAETEFKNLLNRGRKYGAIVTVVAQAPAEISTTARNQCKNRYVGLMDGEHDAKAASKLISVPQADIEAIEPDTLTFFSKKSGLPAEKIRFKYIPD